MSFEMNRVRHLGDVQGGSWGAMSKLTFTTKVMPMFGLSLLVAAAGSYVGLKFMTMPLLIASFVCELVLVFSSPWWQRKEGLNKVLFAAYALLSGITLVPLLTWVGMRGGVMMIAEALSVTTITFVGLAIYGMTTKRDFSNMGGYIFIGCLGLFAAGLLNMFVFQSSMFSLACSMGGVAIFSAFAVYEMNMIRTQYEDADWIGASLGMFIAFMGLFTSILRMFGILGSSSDD